MTMNTVPSIKCVSRKYNVNMYNVQRKYDVMHMPTTLRMRSAVLNVWSLPDIRTV